MPYRTVCYIMMTIMIIMTIIPFIDEFLRKRSLYDLMEELNKIGIPCRYINLKHKFRLIISYTVDLTSIDVLHTHPRLGILYQYEDVATRLAKMAKNYTISAFIDPLYEVKKLVDETLMIKPMRDPDHIVNSSSFADDVINLNPTIMVPVDRHCEVMKYFSSTTLRVEDKLYLEFFKDPMDAKIGLGSHVNMTIIIDRQK